MNDRRLRDIERMRAERHLDEEYEREMRDNERRHRSRAAQVNDDDNGFRMHMQTMHHR